MKETLINWSTHIEFLVIFFTLIGGYYHLDTKIDVQCMSNTSRIDQVNDRVDLVNARLDQLYTMFIDLVKERKSS